MKARTVLIGMLLFLACACQKQACDEPVQFVVQAGEVTKAGDGSAVTQLFVGVLDQEGHALEDFRRVVTRTSSAEDFVFELTLVKGMRYQVVLFAQAAEAYLASTGFTSTSMLRAVPVPATLALNDEGTDAFYACLEVDASEMTQNVALARAWAQVNVASTLAVDAGTTVRLTVSSVPETFDTVTGNVSGTREMTMSGTCLNGVAFEQGGNLVAFGYVPVGKDGALVDVSVKVVREGTEVAREILNMPLEPNYRTNIMGDI